MKKIFKALFVVVFLFMLVSCSSSDENNSNNSSTSNWQYSQYSTSGLFDGLTRKKWRFNENNKIYEEYMEVFYKDNWVIVSEVVSKINEYGQEVENLYNEFYKYSGEKTHSITRKVEYFEINGNDKLPKIKSSINENIYYTNSKIESGEKDITNYNIDGTNTYTRYIWNTDTNKWEEYKKTDM